MAQRIGERTISFNQNIGIVGFASVVGPKEGEGPLGSSFDYISKRDDFGESSWEKAESQMQNDALQRALAKASLAPGKIQAIFAGDLLNQCIGSSFGLRDFEIPLVGLYGACSTMTEALILASVFSESGCATFSAAITSSHFCSAERQFRFPLEYGGQRSPASQWTVTGSGAVILSGNNFNAKAIIKSAVIGKIVDFGIDDISNMGAAMAPAAVDTICSFFKDTGTTPNDYDLIMTGDLGYTGHTIARELLTEKGFATDKRFDDAGCMIYHRKKQDVHSGGSGCGCSASVLCAHVIPNIISGNLKKVLLVGTGALMSTTSSQQGETIPGIAHLVEICGV